MMNSRKKMLQAKKKCMLRVHENVQRIACTWKSTWEQTDKCGYDECTILYNLGQVEQECSGSGEPFCKH